MDQNKVNYHLSQLRNLQKNAYAPYSNFFVAAVVVLKDGQEFVGVNVENAAYPACICAERCALTQMVAKNKKTDQVDYLFLMTNSATMGTPCGICRQVMAELMPKSSQIYIANTKSKTISDIVVVKNQDLLPSAFLADNLGV